MGPRASLHDVCQNLIERRDTADAHRVNVHIQWRDRRFKLRELRVSRRKIQFMKDGNASERWDCLLEQINPLFGQLGGEDADARGVAAWSCKTCNKTVTDWIADARKNNRDGFGRHYR